MVCRSQHRNGVRRRQTPRQIRLLAHRKQVVRRHGRRCRIAFHARQQMWRQITRNGCPPVLGNGRCSETGQQSHKEAHSKTACRYHKPPGHVVENTFHESSVTSPSPAPKRTICTISFVVSDRLSVRSAMSKTVCTASSRPSPGDIARTSLVRCPRQSEVAGYSPPALPRSHLLPSLQSPPPAENSLAPCRRRGFSFTPLPQARLLV